MAPPSLKRLTALQASRLADLESISNRLREKDRSTFNLNIIESRVQRINAIWNEAYAAHAEIIVRENVINDTYTTGNVYARIQELYDDTSDFLMTIKTDLEAANESVRSERLSTAEAPIDNSYMPAKIPKMELPTFSGDYENWENFYDLFSSLVHNSPRFSNSTKLQYLKSCLKGEAADWIKDIKTTDANYQSTWEALRERFHSPRFIVNKYFGELWDLPYLKKEESMREIQAFTDKVRRITNALKNLGMPVEAWDPWYIFILAARLPPDARKLWENEMAAADRRAASEAGPNSSTPTNSLDKFPKFSTFLEFLERQTTALNIISADHKTTEKPAPQTFRTQQNSRKVFHASESQSNDGRTKCPICTGAHKPHKCYSFKAKTPTERRAEVRRLKLCYNCLGNHRASECNSTYRCSKCNGKHHTMVHETRGPPNAPRRASAADPAEAQADDASKVKVHTASLSAQNASVILATAQLTLEGPNGIQTRVRALLDQGSEISIVSDAIANLLNLPRTRVNIPLTGLAASAAATARAATTLRIKSLTDSSFKIETHALILPKLTSQLPSRRAVPLDFKLIEDLQLADPQFFVPDSVDVILGADIYGQLLRVGLRNFPSSSLIAQNTALGWIVSGPAQVSRSRRAAFQSPIPRKTLHCAPDIDLDESLQRFWKLEEPPAIIGCSPQEEACERHFKETHSRASDGRYVVRLPLKSEVPRMAAETRRIALNSLKYTHRRLDRDPQLSTAYCDFMSEYEALGHMERVPESEIDNPRAWYLPHHAVVQSTPEKWKLRVVFDASRKTQNKYCLNDFLEPGPPLQRDLSLTILNWCLYQYAFTADMVKMFRQIGVAPEDRDLQRILWAPKSHLRPVDYRLTTVTYGTSSAPYLSLRTLKQLAADESTRYPLGVQCLEENTYIDDTFAGADELETAVKMRDEFAALLRSAGIELGKWAANHPDLLPISDVSSGKSETKTISPEESVKTLGIRWNPSLDEFKFTSSDFKSLAGEMTKRAVLSNIARLFDPLGWLSPITVNAKILMQDLWILKCGWDEQLPEEIRERWLDYCRSLSALPSLSISRWLGTTKSVSAQIHGFSDASSRAYAAAIYLRVQLGNDRYRVSLLAAKCKVAPVKTISIPNLELCGAALLVKTLLHIRQLDFLRNLPIFAWTDSQIVLTWLRKHPCHWKTFVANRTSYIQTELPSAVWAHVPTKENPADLATRGCNPSDLTQTDLWWRGPAWLALKEEHWPKTRPAPQVMHAQVSVNEEPELLRRYSSLSRLIRVVAYCRRPLLRLRRRQSGLDALPAYITSIELNEARFSVIRMAQTFAFASELKLIRAGKSLPKRHPLLSLNPVLHEDGILRVGGRLTHASLPHEQRHPPILPHRSALSRLIVSYAHKACLHGGPTLTSNTVMLHAWILGRNQLVKTEVRKCITCQRVKPRLAQQMMGSLPASRVTPARAFSSSGLDYAGPFQIRASKGRGFKSYKGYIALFVCFSTRAIHLEAVSDLTANSFLAAYKRFAGRRGICKNLYSDNATTFRAADKELQSMFKAASEFYKLTASSLSNDGTSWSFIPPNSPHYGGLWEAGIKSVKHHLKRACGDKLLTFEEFSTVLVEIEACLNSRPLSPLSSDVDDLQALTPAHFLIGDASGLIPDEAPPCIPENRLERYHVLQNIRNSFWKRWSSEYLQHLQERGKWREPSENFAVGQLVLLRDDRYPPSKWPLGRVMETHLGPDGLVRVVTIRTANSMLRRHIARLCPLILEDQPKV